MDLESSAPHARGNAFASFLVRATVACTATIALAAGTALAASPPASGTAADAALGKKVQAAAEGRGPEVSIPFADHGGIRDWRAVGRDTLLVQGTGNRWYRVELFAPCFDLPFVERVGFDANPTGEFDRFSAIVVRGRRCAVRSVTASAPPLPRTKDATAKGAAGAKNPAAAKDAPAPAGGTAGARAGTPGTP